MSYFNGKRIKDELGTYNKTKKTKTELKTATWLPGFSGFYGSIWEENTGEEMELENVNEVRKEKGLPQLENDMEFDYDYRDYFGQLSKCITDAVSVRLKDDGFIDDWHYEKLSSPKEYNFVKDAIHVTFSLNSSNQKAIREFLRTHKEEFSEYLINHYSSYDGFLSSYSNNVEVWLVDDYLTHEHKLGAVLNFILETVLKAEGHEGCLDFWIADKIETPILEVKNYDQLVNVGAV